MLKKFTLLLPMLLFTAVTLAQPKVFQFSKGEQQIALFGTMHLSRPDFFPLPDEVLATLQQADALALELDVNDPEVTQVTMQMMMTQGMLTDKSLVEVIGEARLQRLREVSGSSATMFETMRPWLIAVTLPMLQAVQMGYAETGVDEYLANKAIEKSIAIISLETPEEQFNTLLSMSDEEALTALDSALSEESKAELALTEKVWRGDEKAASQLLTEMENELPALFKKLVTDRNHLMVTRAIQFNADKKRLFVGVGAAHLYGDEGMINLLIKQGYQLKTSQ